MGQTHPQKVDPSEFLYRNEWLNVTRGTPLVKSVLTPSPFIEDAEFVTFDRRTML
jgi:hypothetical protein